MINFFKRHRRKLTMITLSGILLALSPFIWRGWVHGYYQRYVYAVDSVPSERIAIVFGAEVLPDGRLSHMLADRVEIAIELYKTGRVQKLVMSGDNRFTHYDEPGRMMEYAIAQGVPAEDIQPDYAGRRTYDTCYRAKAIFQIDSAILVTQGFHLTRALYTCRSLGVEAVGVPADIQRYLRRVVVWSNLREVPATALALVDVVRGQPAEVLGKVIPIQ